MVLLKNSRVNAFKITLLAVPLLLAACGSNEGAPAGEKMSEQGREFSEADKQAALALSIGNVRALSADTSGYDRSLSCSIALQSVYAQFSESGQLDTPMVKAVDQVRASYDQQVQELGSAENKSAAEIAADRQQRAEEISDQSERGQIAIGCLRAMAQP